MPHRHALKDAHPPPPRFRCCSASEAQAVLSGMSLHEVQAGRRGTAASGSASGTGSAGGRAGFAKRRVGS